MSNRRFALAAAAVLLASACTTSPPNPSPTSGPSAGPSTAPSTSPSSAPSSPGPSATATADCPAGPLTVTAFLASDARCYLAAEVTVVGWWDRARGGDAGGTTNRFDSVLRGGVPFMAVEATGIPPSIRIDHATVDAITFEGWAGDARWVEVTARRSMPLERLCWRDPWGDLNAPPTCEDVLVASRIREATPPASALAGCPPAAASAPMPVEVFRAYPTACFGARVVAVRGWLDVLYIIAGWEANWGMEPRWLWRPIGPWTVLVDGSDANSPDRLTLWFDPARGVAVGATNRWVVVTGHYADPSYTSCRYVYDSSGGDDVKPADAIAVRTCRDQFVVTSIADTTP